MPAAEWTLDLARRWVAPTYVRWHPWALGGAAVLVVTVLSLSTGGKTCSTAVAGFCVTDPMFPLPIGLLVVGVVLAWWSPLVAAGCALVFAVLVAVAYPDEPVVLAAAIVLVALHLTHLLVLRREASVQVSLAARSEVAVPRQWRQAPPGTSPPEPVGLRWGLPVGLALLAAVSFVLLVRALLVDRVDLLAEVVLEAPDRTLWALATLALFWVSLVLGHGVRVRNRRAALAAQPPATGLPLRYATEDEDGDVLSLVLPAVDLIFARLWVTPAAATEHTGGPPSRHLETAVLVGELRPGGWCALATPAGLVLPAAQLEPAGDFPGTHVLDAELDRFVDDKSRDPLERLQLWDEPDVGDARTVHNDIPVGTSPTGDGAAPQPRPHAPPSAGTQSEMVPPPAGAHWEMVPPPAGAQWEVVPPTPIEAATYDGPTRRAMVLRTLREASPDVSPPRVLVKRPRRTFANSAALMAGAVASAAWIFLGGLMYPSRDSEGIVLGWMFLVIFLVCAGASLEHRLRADHDGIDSVGLEPGVHIHWSDLDHIDIVRGRSDANGGAYLVFVTHDHERVRSPRLSGKWATETGLYQLGQTLLAMRDHYAPPREREKLDPR